MYENKIIVIVNGNPTSGKDTFCEICHKLYPNSVSFSYADMAKSIARVYAGWTSDKKDLNSRKFLSDLLDSLSEYDDLPFKTTCERIENCDASLVFVHVREPKIIDRFRIKYNAIPILVDRKELNNKKTSNHADADIHDYRYVYVIDNNGDLENLQNGAITFLQELKLIG